MVYQLVKRDPAWKLALGMIAVFALAGLFAPRTLGLSGVLVILGSATAGLLQSRNLLVRATLFHAALPIPGRQLFQARAVVCLSLAAGPFLAAAAAYLLAHPGNPQVSLALVAAGAVFAFATLCGLSLRISALSGPHWLAALFVWTGIPVVACCFRANAALPILAAAALACLIRWLTVWPRVPLSFQTAPFEPVETPARRPSAAVSPSAWWAIIRASFSWQAWIMIPFVVMQALYLNVLFAMFFGFAIPSQIRLRTRWLIPLPLSPRASLALLLLPYLLPLAGAYAVAANFGLARSLAPRSVMDVASGKATVDVPVEYWRRAQHGVPPVAQAPWGESFQPAVTKILGFAIYNPYSSGASNSDRFQYWQYSRAAQTIYGEPLTFADVEAARRAGTLTPIVMRGRARIFGTALLLAFALFGQWAIGLFSWRRLSGRRIRQVISAALVATFFSALGLEIWFPAHHVGTLSTALFNGLVLDAMRWIPDQLPATLAAAILAVAIPYWFVERQFKESEDSGQPRSNY